MTGLLLAALLGAVLLTGCRAFEPETVIVNNPPETFIIGAPLEDGGGYYRYHVYWYGSDKDGRVERFVWALTDTTLQDDDTTDDEEDQNFNPALDATTLEIGHWTTRTDSIFNFTIDQGTSPSVDMTLHMVAIDDFGDFDRTPARLHFFANTLGNPQISFFRIDGNDTTAIASGQPDTVGFGLPYQVFWAGSSPNVRGFTPEALAAVDTVAPYDDGLFGYKWQIMGDLGGNCQSGLEDCWHPRRFDEATGDSFSFFGPGNTLRFENDASGSSPFRKRLPSGPVDLLINSIDIAGVEVSEFRREFGFMVNFDPETRLLDGEMDVTHPGDPETYPYYIMLNDPAQTHFPFRSGERIPDRTYVVFKALARDNPADQPLNPDFGIGFTGFMSGVRSNYFGGNFSFSSDASELNLDPTWGPDADGWYADTLGFLTGPRTEFTISMQAVDEHGRRDGSPAELSFEVGYPPCVQCIELLPKTSSTSAWPAPECVDDPATHPCFQDVTELRVVNPLQGVGPDNLEHLGARFILVNRQTFFTQVVVDTTGQGTDNFKIPADLFRMSVLLHGSDDPREAWPQAVRRSMGWQYQIDYECDPFNDIKDGGGSDDIKSPTWGKEDNFNSPLLEIDSGSGLWRLNVDVAVPSNLFLGPELYLTLLNLTETGEDLVLAQKIFDATTRQFGDGTVRAVVLDQTQCGFFPTRPAKYNYFRGVRPSVAELPSGLSWRDCTLNASIQGIKGGLTLSQGAMASNVGTDGWVTKPFRLVVETNTGDFVCEAP